jgi:hypothetical protein
MTELPTLLLFDFFAALILVIALFVGAYFPFKANPRSFFLSFSAGVTISYVFVHLIPHLSVQADVIRSDILSLFGAVIFIGVDKYASTRRNHAFVVQTVALSAYTFIIGYELGVAGPLVAVCAYVVSLGLHLVHFSFDNRKVFPELYQHIGLWVLAGSIMAGAVLGPFLSEVMFNPFAAVLIGGIIFNSLKEEIPQENKSRYLPFLAGAMITLALFLLI